MTSVTRSDRAAYLLQHWETTLPQFVKVVSLEYCKAQQQAARLAVPT